MNKKSKKQKKLFTFFINRRLLALYGLLWFILISYLTILYNYQNITAHKLADMYSLSTTFENVLKILIVVASMLPSGVFLAISYNSSLFSNNKLKFLFVSLTIAMALYVPFSWCNFIVSFPK